LVVEPVVDVVGPVVGVVVVSVGVVSVAVVGVAVCVAVLVVWVLVCVRWRFGVCVAQSTLVSCEIVFAPWLRFEMSVELTPPSPASEFSNCARSLSAVPQLCSFNACATLLSSALSRFDSAWDSKLPELPQPASPHATRPTTAATNALYEKPIRARL
jgi:hypothetical protein